MRIYLDSNIFRFIKTESKQYNPKLLEAVDRLVDVLIFVFSEAHLNDLSKSESSYRVADLLHMEKYTGRNYFTFDQIKKRDEIFLATPTEAYESIDYLLMYKALENPLAAIRETFENEDLSDYKDVLNSLLDIPFPEANSIQFGSEYKPTLGSVISGFNDVSKFLTEKEEFVKFQNLIRAYVSRDEYSYEKWSFEFDSKMRETSLGKTFTEFVEIVCSSFQKEDTFNRFVNTYIQLEFLGVTEERAGSKRKKNSYMDLYRDAAHAYYASKTDYFVTDDRGVQNKAFIAYQILSIDTEVLSVAEFINKSSYLKVNEDDVNSLASVIGYSIKTGLIIHHTQSNQQVIKLQSRILNYFDRLQLEPLSHDTQTILLFRTMEDNLGVMFSEFELLYKKCVRLFGLPHDGKQLIKLEEYESVKKEDRTRRWSLDNYSVELGFGETTYCKEILFLKINIHKFSSF